MNIVIRYDGVDITDDVLITEALFASQVNGTPGTCQFTVRDSARDKNFVTGKEIGLEINGTGVWLGFSTAVKRVYAFAAQDVEPVTNITRLIAIQGVDINVLFRRRALLKKASPTHLEGPVYPVATPDTTVIADIVANWLDLSSDALDTSSLVTNVGNVNVDQKAQPYAGGMSWEEAMRTIARITGAVFYLNPARKLVYVDVDTPTAPFVLSDTPSGSEVGYRELTILNDASDMVNDVLAIGAGGGSATPVAKRQQDATSIAAHGRWQMGTLHTGIYKQASINKVADSIINGSPLSHRGHKDDHISVQATVFEPGLQPAQKVSFISDVFGYSDVLPIRRMEISFPTPTDARYRLTLGHEIDLPFDPFDPIHYKWPGFPGFPPFPGWHVPSSNCVDAVSPCRDLLVIDDFERADITGDWGTADSGFLWQFHDNPFNPGHVRSDVYESGLDGGWPDHPAERVGALGTVFSGITPAGSAYMRSASGERGPWTSSEWTLKFRLAWEQEALAGPVIGVVTDGSGQAAVQIGGSQILLGSLVDDTNGAADFAFTHDEVYWVQIHFKADTVLEAKVWRYIDAEPVDYMVHGTPDVVPSASSYLFISSPRSTTFGEAFEIAEIAMVDCTAPFDAFDRNTADYVIGTATSGVPWTVSGTTAGVFFGVAKYVGSPPAFAPADALGSLFMQEEGSGSGVLFATLPSGGQPWESAAGFTMTAAFSVANAAATFISSILQFRLLDSFGTAYGELRMLMDNRHAGEFGAGETGNIRLDGTILNKTNWLTEQSDNGYMLKWNRIPGMSRIKLWTTGQPEPDDWLIESANPAPVPLGGFFQLRCDPTGLDPFGTNYDDGVTLYVLDFTQEAPECLPASGFVCEDIAIGGSVYSTSGSYRAGTLEVYVNGIVQRPGVDYTELDPLSGWFTMTTDPTSGLRACYDRITSTGGYPIASIARSS